MSQEHDTSRSNPFDPHFDRARQRCDRDVFGDSATLAKTAGRRTESSPKRARESLKGLVARLKRELRHRAIARLQPLRCPFQSQTAYVLHHALPSHPAKNSMKGIRRKARDGGELIQVDRLVQVILQVHLRAQHALPIRLCCSRANHFVTG